MLKFPKPEPKAKKAKKKTKTPRQRLIDECDQLVRDILKTRPRVCCTCGKPEAPGFALQVGHWIKRGKLWVRWDMRNVHPQCFACNGRHNHWTVYYDDFMVRTYSHSTLQALTALGVSSKKMGITDILKVKEGLQMLRGDHGND